MNLPKILSLLAAILLSQTFPHTSHARCVDAYYSDSVKTQLDRVLEHSGLPSTNFEVKATHRVSNAVATMCNGHRYIYVNERWMNSIRNGDWNWRRLSVLAHEIGHHILGHTMTSSPSHKTELEADRYSGHLLFHMGASLQDTTAMARRLPENATPTHPRRTDRIAAITAGWRNARNPIPVVVAGSSFPNPETYWQRGFDVDAIGHGPTTEDEDARWHLVLTHQDAGRQRIHRRASINNMESAIDTSWDDGYLIEKLLYLDDVWVALMTRRRGYAEEHQTWTTSDNLDTIEESIDSGFENGLYISSLTHGDGRYALVMTEGNLRQIYRVRRSYSAIDEIIDQQWERDYFITNLSYSRAVGWILVMTQGDNREGEMVRRRPYFPEELIEFYAGDGYRVAHLSYDGRKWMLVMTTRDLRLEGW